MARIDSCHREAAKKRVRSFRGLLGSWSQLLEYHARWVQKPVISTHLSKLPGNKKREPFYVLPKSKKVRFWISEGKVITPFIGVLTPFTTGFWAHYGIIKALNHT